MTDALADLLRACHVAGVPATAEDVVDAAWLARWMADTSAIPPPATQAPPEAERPRSEAEPPTPEQPPEPLATEEEAAAPADSFEPPPDLPPEPELDRDTTGESIGVYLPSGANQPGAAGRVFRAPGAPALPRALEIARALRPLSRRVASRTRFVLDEAETIRRFAEEQVCNPALRPAQERWLRLALVLDTGTGSDLWREAAREFRSLLACLGAFRDVRTWSLDTGASPPRLTPGTSADGVARKPKELIDPTGRTLTVVLSPCIASGWHDGSVAAVLAEWAERGPVVLVQLLPEYLWPRTALAPATAVQMTAPAAGTANRRLALTRPDAWPGEETPEGVAVPVAVLEPKSLREWAGLVAGRPGAETPGFVLDTHPVSAAPETPVFATPAAQVEHFRQRSSRLARRLAGLLAAAPAINLPIIRLIREALLPQAGQPQEAEVLFGGLLKRVTDSPASDPRFEFLPGVREALLDAVPTDESVPVLAAVSDYLGHHLASGRTFSAVLADPASAAGELVADASPFAQIAAEVLLRAGGAYAQLVRQRGRSAAPTAPVRTEDAAKPEESFPRQFGDYILESKISDGPVNVVYRAIDARGRRTAPPVALKTPRAGAACSAEVRAGLQKEAEILAALAQLQSPNICHIFDTGEIYGCPYFTMEYVPGETLAAYWAREGPRNGPWEAANLVHSLALALSRIHAVTLDGEPILHRNITPQNILVVLGEGEPRFVLVDFGPNLTSAEAGYSAPEELVPGWRGYSVTPRSDIYSLGAVLYWMLTGCPPFTGDNRQQLTTAILNEVIRSPSTINPALTAFNELCWRVLARHPDDRYQSMREFADAIIATYREYKPNTTEPEADTEPPPVSLVDTREQLLDVADELAEVEQLRDIAQKLRSHTRDPEATEAKISPDDATEPDWPTGVARAELEATNTVQTATGDTPKSPTQVGQPQVHTWRRPLPLNQPVRVGRDPDFCDFAVPNDQLISRFHATVEWNGTELTVVRRGMQTGFPTPPANHIWFKNKPVEQCTVQPGQSFIIGLTRFSLHSELAEGTDRNATVANLPDSLSPSLGMHIDPAGALRAIERLQREVQRPSDNVRAHWRTLLEVVRETLPVVEAAAVIQLPAASRTQQPELIVLERSARDPAQQYTPSPALCRHAIMEQKESCLHVGADEHDDFGRFSTDENLLNPPWEICVPYRDGSRLALTITGRTAGLGQPLEVGLTEQPTEWITRRLGEYERLAEGLVAIVEMAGRASRLHQHQQAMRNRLWPISLRKVAESPEELARLLTPQVQEVTALFCNLSDYASYTSRHLDQLLQAQQEVARALNSRATVITERGGLVVGQHGEAILGFWGWPTPQEDQVETAARAAMLMQLQTTPGLLAGRLGLGLTHGVAVVGRLSPHDAATVDVYGPVVDLAPSLGELAETYGVGIVLNEEVALRLRAVDPSGGRWRIRRLGRVRLPGFPALNIYDLNWSLGKSSLTAERYRELLTLWHEAIEFFTGGNWQQAREALEADFATDPAARYLLGVMARSDGTPPDDWDGSFVP